jgi:hypothetical protein
MISLVIKEKIENKFNSPVRYSKDCDLLAAAISHETRSKISGSTMKRLFGIIPTKHNPSLYTLDVLSIYLGYANYDELINEFRTHLEPLRSNIKELSSMEITPKLKFKVSYDKKFYFTLERLENQTLRISETNDARWKKDDLIEFKRILINYPLFIDNHIRLGIPKGEAIVGKVLGVRTIENVSGSITI